MTTWLAGLLRGGINRHLLKESTVTLKNSTPPLERSFQGIEEFGLYLHIPFCRQICPYCPYNKVIYHPQLAERYANAVKKEIDDYAELIGTRPVTSLYIGGGTPTTMLYTGLASILEHLYSSLNMQCDIHMESHPDDLTAPNLRTIASLGVNHLSIGIEALQDHHLLTLARPYSAREALAAITRAVDGPFKCVNADFIFALPGQTYDEVEQVGHTLVSMGVDQVAAYPLFTFPYTKMGQDGRQPAPALPLVLKRRRMLGILEDIFYKAGFERTSVWAFTKPEIPKYCSVTVPLYVGLGASGASYLKDTFYVNTFNVQEYIRALEKGALPIALSLPLTSEMQMAGWLYWRIYETRFQRSEFKKRFGREFDPIYGRYLKPLALAGLLTDHGDEIVLSARGAYWLHTVQDLFSLDYVSKLWGTSKEDPWPVEVIL